MRDWLDFRWEKHFRHVYWICIKPTLHGVWVATDINSNSGRKPPKTGTRLAEYRLSLNRLDDSSILSIYKRTWAHHSVGKPLSLMGLCAWKFYRDRSLVMRSVTVFSWSIKRLVQFPVEWFTILKWIGRYLNIVSYLEAYRFIAVIPVKKINNIAESYYLLSMEPRAAVKIKE